MRLIPLNMTHGGGHYLLSMELGRPMPNHPPFKLIMDTASGQTLVFGCEANTTEFHRFGSSTGEGFGYSTSGNLCFNQTWNYECLQDGDNNNNNNGTTCSHQVEVGLSKTYFVDYLRPELFIPYIYSLGPSLQEYTTTIDDVHVENSRVWIGIERNYDSKFYWNGTDGQFGIEFVRDQDPLRYVSPFEELLFATSTFQDRAIHDSIYLYSLDLQPWLSPTPSYLTLNGYLNAEDQPVEWAERPMALNDSRYWYFNMYHLSLCGVSVFGNYSAYWPVLIDSGASWLTLPAEMFDAFISWAPVGECGYGLYLKNPAYFVCQVGEDALQYPDRMPPLTFALSDNGVAHGISLRNLVVPATPDTPSVLPAPIFAVKRGNSLGHVKGIPTHPGTSKISVGARFLSGFTTVFDTKTGLVGFRGRVPLPNTVPLAEMLFDASHPDRATFLAPADHFCPSTVSCHGAETYYQPQNACIAPDCSIYFFRALDRSNGYCVLSYGFEATLITTILIATLMEIYLYRGYQKLAKFFVTVDPL